jgi:hypothetical protein
MSEDKHDEKPGNAGGGKAEGRSLGWFDILVRILFVGLVVAFLVFGVCLLMLRRF